MDDGDVRLGSSVVEGKEEDIVAVVEYYTHRSIA